jgi:hypothetical protein
VADKCTNRRLEAFEAGETALKEIARRVLADGKISNRRKKRDRLRHRHHGASNDIDDPTPMQPRARNTVIFYTR